MCECERTWSIDVLTLKIVAGCSFFAGKVTLVMIIPYNRDYGHHPVTLDAMWKEVSRPQLKSSCNNFYLLLLLFPFERLILNETPRTPPTPPLRIHILVVSPWGSHRINNILLEHVGVCVVITDLCTHGNQKLVKLWLFNDSVSRRKVTRN